MFRGLAALPPPKAPLHPYPRRRIKRHTWQASGLVLAAFVAGVVVGVLL